MLPKEYEGDEKLEKILSGRGIKCSIAEIRATFMRDVWRLDFVSPSKTVQEVIGNYEFASKEDASAVIMEMMALWNHLAQYQDDENDFKLYPIPQTKTSIELLTFVRSRIAEVKCFLPMFDVDTDKFPLLKPSFGKSVADALESLSKIENELRLCCDADPSAFVDTKRISILQALDTLVETAINAFGNLAKLERSRIAQAFRDHKEFLEHNRHIGRNEPCPCGSGKKYKKCCLMGPGVTEPGGTTWK